MSKKLNLEDIPSQVLWGARRQLGWDAAITPAEAVPDKEREAMTTPAELDAYMHGLSRDERATIVRERHEKIDEKLSAMPGEEVWDLFVSAIYPNPAELRETLDKVRKL